MSIYTYTFKISNIFCGNCIPKIKKIISNYPIKSLKINIFTKMIKLELFNKKIFKKIKNDLIKNNYKISNDNNYFKNLFLYFIYLFILQIIFVYKPNIYFFNILLSFFIIFNFYKKILKNNICFTDIIFFGSISSFFIGIIDKNNTYFLVSTIIILSIINGRFIIERISNKAIENLEIDRTEEYLKYKNLENNKESILKSNKEFILEKDEKLENNKELILEKKKDLENNKESILESNKELNTNNIKDNFVQFQDLRENHIIWLKDNQYILFDGIILEGQSFVDESPITGEIKLKKKQKNDKIFSGSFNKKGKILVRILKIGKETFYSNLLENLNLQKKK